MMLEETTTKKERCAGCQYCKIVNACFGWSFYGCYCEPYRGKWVAEIKDCPKEMVGEE